MAKDFSEYEMSEAEKYRAVRSNTPYLRLDYFNNTVSFPRGKGVMGLAVDDNKEFVSMFDAMEKAEWIATDGCPRPDITDEEMAAEFAKMDLQDRKQNEEVLASLQKKYRIDRRGFDAWAAAFYHMHPDEKEQPLNNVLSGARITLPIGEGILDFIYADFVPPFTQAKRFMAFFWNLNQEDVKKMLTQTGALSVSKPTGQPFSDATEGENPVSQTGGSEKIKREVQLDAREYYRYSFSVDFLKDITYSSLYSAICPPILLNDKYSFAGLCRYYLYLRSLQKEYRMLLEFCLDEEYRPEILSFLRPEERFHLFRLIYHLPLPLERQEHFSFLSPVQWKQEGLDELPAEAAMDRKNIPQTNEKSFQDFVKDFEIREELLGVTLQIPVFMVPQYDFHSVADILSLEFSKVLETGTRIRKCKRCGKYFLMKGNYDTQYCSRIAPGETRKCNELAAQENYRKKAGSNQALNIYSKYYRRYSARLKVNQIKEDEFKRWRYAAILKRDECTDGVITVEELIDWMEAYFPNRQRKK